MKNDKLMDVFKTFEKTSLENIKGGCYKITYQSGSGRCDIADSSGNDIKCDVRDNLAVGTILC